MKTLIVYAHPEPRSLNAAIRDFTAERLRSRGHTVEVSDLYAMGWKAPIDRDDFANLGTADRMHVAKASGAAYAGHAQSSDIADEQRKLMSADALILQFPLWWFSMPAIMKGWVDRVYAHGLAYGVGEHSDARWGDRYGEGTFAGKRAMLVVTAGGWRTHYTERGVNGHIDDLLFPINHGILWYPGFDVLVPHVIYSSDRLSTTQWQTVADELGARLDRFWTDAPIPFRRQNDGDYVFPALELEPGLSPGRQGLAIHLDDGTHSLGPAHSVPR